MLSEIAYANHVGDFVLDTGHVIQLGNRDQRALGTLPPCCFPISQRGLLGQTGGIPGSKISGGVRRQCYLAHQVCHTAMPLRNVSAELQLIFRIFAGRTHTRTYLESSSIKTCRGARPGWTGAHPQPSLCVGRASQMGGLADNSENLGVGGFHSRSSSLKPAARSQ